LGVGAGAGAGIGSITAGRVSTDGVGIGFGAVGSGSTTGIGIGFGRGLDTGLDAGLAGEAFFGPSAFRFAASDGFFNLTGENRALPHADAPAANDNANSDITTLFIFFLPFRDYRIDQRGL
jgi:hypothetical protein